MINTYADYSKEELLAVVTEYERLISWDTDCISCANVLDSLYELDSVVQKVHDVLAGIPADLRNTHLKQIYSLVEPHVWEHS